MDKLVSDNRKATLKCGYCMDLYRNGEFSIGCSVPTAEDLLTDLIGVYKQLSQEDTQDIVTSCASPGVWVVESCWEG